MKLVAIAGVLVLAGCGSDQAQPRPEVGVVAADQVFTLLTGDRARVPGAGTTCAASHEGAQKNLFCRRIGGGRNDVVFYADSALVWLSDSKADSYSWTPGPSQPTDATGGSHVYTLQDGDLLSVPGAATLCDVRAEGGSTRLVCGAMGGGSHQIVLSKDDVVVWDTDSPDAPVKVYEWAPTPS